VECEKGDINMTAQPFKLTIETDIERLKAAGAALATDSAKLAAARADPIKHLNELGISLDAQTTKALSDALKSRKPGTQNPAGVVHIDL
jgi:hypothetical protein